MPRAHGIEVIRLMK